MTSDHLPSEHCPPNGKFAARCFSSVCSASPRPMSRSLGLFFFVTSVAVLVAAPSYRLIAAACLALSMFQFVPQRGPSMFPSKQLLLISGGAMVVLFFSQPDAVLPIATFLATIAVGTAASDYSLGYRPSRDTVETLFAISLELFTYASATLLVLGIAAANENRVFLASTFWDERASFPLASSGAQGTVLAGAALVFALSASSETLGPLRRALLTSSSALLLLAGNYRFVTIVVLSVLLIIVWHRCRARKNHYPSFRKQLRIVAAVGLLFPVFWLAASRLIAGTPGLLALASSLGHRSTTRDSIDELMSLNGRTRIWHSVIDDSRADGLVMLFGRHADRHLDVELSSSFRTLVVEMFEGSYVDVSFISAHNVLMEVFRHGGLAGLALASIFLFLVNRSASNHSLSVCAAATVILGSSGTEMAFWPGLNLSFGLLVIFVVAKDGLASSSGVTTCADRTPLDVSAPGLDERRQSSNFGRCN